MIRNETFKDGVRVRCETIDYAGDSFNLEVDGVLVESRVLTPEERQMYGPQPLDSMGALATLMAVLELSTVEDAANAVGLTAEDLVSEAEAWQLMVE